MANVSIPEGEDYRGIAIPDPRWKASAFVRADSTITEANPRPGIPVPSRASGMVLEASGTMPVIAGLIPSLVLTANQGGVPGSHEARFSFAPNYSLGAGYETAIGWDAPTALSRNEVVNSGANDFSMEGCVRLRSNTVLLGAYEATLNRFVISRKTFDTAIYATNGTVRWEWATAALDTGDDTYQALIPGTLCFLQLPEGRVHAYYMVKDTTITGVETFGQVIQMRSDDDGVTWTRSSKGALRPQINMSSSFLAGNDHVGFDITRMRCAYSNGEVLLLIGGISHLALTYTYCNALWQFASSDLGQTFEQIDLGVQAGAYVAGAGTDLAAANIDVVALKQGGFCVSFNRVRNAAGVGQVQVQLLGNAYTPWTSVTPVGVYTGAVVGYLSNQRLLGTNTALAVDEDGALALSWQEDLFGYSRVALSKDGGTTWDFPIYSLAAVPSATIPHPWWYSGDPQFYPFGYCSTFQCGRLMLFAPFMVWDGGGQHDASVLSAKNYFELDLGGYTTATRAFTSSEETDQRQLVWAEGWVAGQRLRDTTGWAWGASTGTETLNVLGWSDLVTGAGQVISLVNNTSLIAVLSTEYRVMLQAEWAVTAGTGGLTININNAGNDIVLEILQSATTLTISDMAAGPSALYTGASPALAGFVQVLVSIDYFAQRVMVWARAAHSDTEARPWKKVVDYAALSVGALVAAPSLVIDIPQNSNVKWRGVNYGSGQHGRPMFRGATAAAAGWLDTIYGRAFSPYPIHVYSGAGVRVAAVDGPAWDGDSWTITQRHEYGVENVFADVAPSPRKTWRSVGTAQEEIVVQLDYTADPTPLLGRVLVVGAFGCNFDSLTIQYRTTAGGGAWNALGVLSLNQAQTSLKWIRDGKIVRPDTAAGAFHAGDYYTYNILEGSHLLINDGAAAASRKIKTNSEGVWTDTAAAVRSRVYCEDILTTDATSGTAGEIWSKDGIIIIRDCPDICELKFLISPSAAGRIVEGYYEIGSLFVGHLAYFGQQYARGRAMTTTTNTAMTTGRSGARRAQVLGPARRAVEFGWASENETDASALVGLTGGAAPTPDYILPASNSTEPTATPADTPYKMAGLVEAMRGAATPCIYLARAPMVATEAGDTVLVNRNLFMLGRLVSDPRIETVLGNEWSTAGEIMRLATVTFEEEV